MWTYELRTGKLFHHGMEVAQGYSGYREGKNNPFMETVKNVGPIPCGKWLFGDMRDTETHGPCVLPLTPHGAETHGRSGFLIHGDAVHAPGTASHGCIILPRPIRIQMDESEDREIEVV